MDQGVLFTQRARADRILAWGLALGEGGVGGRRRFTPRLLARMQKKKLRGLLMGGPLIINHTDHKDKGEKGGNAPKLIMEFGK